MTMERKEKIEILRGIKTGERDISEFLIKDNFIIIDENDKRPIIKAVKANGNEIIYAKDFDRMAGLIKGFVLDLRNEQIKLLLCGA